MNNKKYQIKESEVELIAERIGKVKKAGHGEVRILVRNGKIYRILSTEDELVKKR